VLLGHGVSRLLQQSQNGAAIHVCRQDQPVDDDNESLKECRQMVREDWLVGIIHPVLS
jgi:hypothetical protein